MTLPQRKQLWASRKAAKEAKEVRASKNVEKDRTISQLESKVETVSQTMESLISQVQSDVPSQIQMSQGSQSHTPPSHTGGRDERIQRQNAGGKTH